jgi:DNA-binding NarL/FixJ family response regulator
MPEIHKTIKVMIVDDHKMFLDGLSSLLKEYTNVTIRERAYNGDEALSKLAIDSDIDVLILDISMPGITGVELCKTVKFQYPKINMLALSMHSDSKTISEIVKNGVRGYILKNTGKEELIEAITTVASGENFYSNEVKNSIMQGISGQDKRSLQSVQLTNREIEILKLIAQELTTQQIADKLFISLHTVESHRKNLMRKVDVKNMVGLIKYAVKAGIIE